MQRRWEIWIVGLVALAAHGASVGGEFLHWDDVRYLVQNEFVHAPSWEGLARLFTEPFYANYHPLHVISYTLDHLIFEHRAWGYHLINVLYFALAAMVILLALRRAFPGARWTWVAALLFAAHPIHVESVAWLSARKDVLALLFGALYALAHLRALESRRSARWWGAGLFLFALALLCKTIVAPLPAALFVYDLLARRRRWRRALSVALAPLVLSVAMLGLAYWAQSSEGAVMAYPGGSPAGALLTMLPVYARYLGSLVVPAHLNALYEVPVRTSPDLAAVGALGLLLALAVAAVWAYRRGHAIPLGALLWMAITLSPVSGIVPLSRLMADRYLLLPSLGFCVLVSWAGAKLLRQRVLVTGLAAATVVALTGASALRSLDWRSDLTLWEDTVRKSPADAVAQLNYGAALADAGRLRAAAVALMRSLELRPGLAQARRNLSRVVGAMERRGDDTGAARLRALLRKHDAP